MTKAYDLTALGQTIVSESKKNGLTVAEDALEKLGASVYVAIKSWVIESAQLSENKIDDVIAPFISQLDGFVLPQIAKIDLDGDGK